jgi:hypothetical protein
MSREQMRAAGWGLLWSGLLAVAIFVGSRNLRHIDAALVGYTFACLFAAFAVAYRYSIWLQRPPTRLYWRRGWQAFLKPGHRWANVKHLAGRFVRLFLLNHFILKRSRPRGFALLLIMWGCILAAIIFPLVYGWVSAAVTTLVNTPVHRWTFAKSAFAVSTPYRTSKKRG